MLTYTPNSKHIYGYEYNESEASLLIVFRPKLRQYKYEQVPKELVKDFAVSSSKSLFFTTFIKNKFKTIRLS